MWEQIFKNIVQDVANFQAWLQTQEDDAYVGSIGQEKGCPIAHWLHHVCLEILEVDWVVRVWRTQVLVYDDLGRYLFSVYFTRKCAWLKKFILAMDSSGITRVTARDALAILSAITT